MNSPFKLNDSDIYHEGSHQYLIKLIYINLHNDTKSEIENEIY